MNKGQQRSRKFKKFFYGLMTAIILIAVPFPVFALGDGAYTVSRATFYANPETGQAVDGGTNIALGDSMCESIVEKELLVEQSQGKTYVTIGIGLMSNISNVKMQTMGKNGTLRNVDITKTGSHQVNGDTCNHYRFEMNSTDDYISPIIYVEPMGREVQFFVKLDMNTAKPGTGVFLSEMIYIENSEDGRETSSKKSETSSPESTNSDSSSEQVSEESNSQNLSLEEIETQPDEVVDEEIETQSDEVNDEETQIQSGNRYMTTGIIVAVIIMTGIGVFMIYKRRKK